ncbi:hypothetical protein SDC9_211466 [bioreactor metagenome]|uniref:Uncharacterized protein n=1 Tax=bioreactor metagenome TaxID=1076179 RepID=A0A645JJG3_9ZZZZ
MILGKFRYRSILFPVGSEQNLPPKNLPDIVAGIMKLKQLRKFSPGNDLLPVFVFILLQQLHRFMKMCNFLLKMHFPDGLDIRIKFILIEGIVEITFSIFVEQKIFQPCAIRVKQRSVLTHMLFFNHGNFLIKLPTQIVVVGVTQIHIKIHGLLLACRDN